MKCLLNVSKQKNLFGCWFLQTFFKQYSWRNVGIRRKAVYIKPLGLILLQSVQTYVCVCIYFHICKQLRPCIKMIFVYCVCRKFRLSSIIQLLLWGTNRFVYGLHSTACFLSENAKNASMFIEENCF